EETFAAVQQEVLAEDDYHWPFEDDLADEEDEDDDLPGRPETLEALARIKEDGDFYDYGGTHSILDVDRVVGPDESGFGTVRPLTPGELVAAFGSESPSVADLDRVHEPGPSGILADLMGEKWTGRVVTLLEDGEPAEAYFWGWSGD
ncbi:MAG: hypothetical protein ACJ72O_06545, partial [Marmoricola sp.]